MERAFYKYILVAHYSVYTKGFKKNPAQENTGIVGAAKVGLNIL